jgi:hypothetical protein
MFFIFNHIIISSSNIVLLNILKTLADTKYSIYYSKGIGCYLGCCRFMDFHLISTGAPPFGFPILPQLGFYSIPPIPPFEFGGGIGGSESGTGAR